jgi:nitrogen fixation protein NifB
VVSLLSSPEQGKEKNNMARDLTQHPCFNDQVRHERGRIHLPVAPRCNIQCHFCNRQYDCVNESRPGVTSAVLTPHQAFWYLEKAVEKDPRLSVVGIAGPGDPFANPEETMATLRLVRDNFPDMLLCVATNGMNIGPYIDELAELDVSHVTITMNAVDPEIGSKIYAWMRDGKKVLRGTEAASRLLARQKEAIARLSAHGIVVKVNAIIIPGINEDHIDEIARAAKEWGADLLNAIPVYPVEGTPFEEIAGPSKEEVEAIRRRCGEHLPLMHHCTRCRADAVGKLGEAMSQALLHDLETAKTLPMKPAEDRPFTAVASREGIIVNEHLGRADSFWIFESTEGGYREVERRAAPEAGHGEHRWAALAETLRDCRALLAANAGAAPERALKREGIRLLLMEGLIEEGLDSVYHGTVVRAPCRAGARCGSGCPGSGTGCG